MSFFVCHRIVFHAYLEVSTRTSTKGISIIFYLGTVPHISSTYIASMSPFLLVDRNNVHQIPYNIMSNCNTYVPYP